MSSCIAPGGFVPDKSWAGVMALDLTLRTLGLTRAIRPAESYIRLWDSPHIRAPNALSAYRT